VYGADGARHQTHRTHDPRSGSQDHHQSKNSVQKTICSNSTPNAPDDGRMYPKRVEPCCIKLAFHIISRGRCTVKQPSVTQVRNTPPKSSCAHKLAHFDDFQFLDYFFVMKVRVKQYLYRPAQAQRVPGVRDCQISTQSA